MGPLLVVAAVLAIVFAIVVVAGRRSRGAREPAPGPAPGREEPLREGLGRRIQLLLGKAPGPEDWEHMQDTLLRADVGPDAAGKMVADLRARFTQDSDAEQMLLEEVVAILGEPAPLDLPTGRLSVIMVVGVNGAGKTTSIGKLGAMLRRQGRTVSLANSDTFRAAAAEQIGVWAERSGAHLVSQDRGADPSSVAFDAVRSASARGSDVLIVDTAGRLHTRTPLMEELKKVRRVLEKAAGRPPDETLLVLDATTGQNGIAQARAFTEAVEVTGVLLTKMDGTAKGGVILAVGQELGVPVKLVGTGERLEHLEPFDSRAFAERLVRG